MNKEEVACTGKGCISKRHCQKYFNAQEASLDKEPPYLLIEPPTICTLDGHKSKDPVGAYNCIDFRMIKEDK